MWLHVYMDLKWILSSYPGRNHHRTFEHHCPGQGTASACNDQLRSCDLRAHRLRGRCRWVCWGGYVGRCELKSIEMLGSCNPTLGHDCHGFSISNNILVLKFMAKWVDDVWCLIMIPQSFQVLLSHLVDVAIESSILSYLSMPHTHMLNTWV